MPIPFTQTSSWECTIALPIVNGQLTFSKTHIFLGDCPDLKYGLTKLTTFLFIILANFNSIKSKAINSMTKLAMITGASSGIGKATANFLASKGYNLIITGRRLERLQQLKSELESAHNNSVVILCFDIRDNEAVKRNISGLSSELKKIDVLVNNAGLASGLDRIQDGDVEDWNKMIDTNIKGLLFISRQVIPLMITNGSGHIVNIGSIAGKEVYPNGNVYCGTKHMVDALNQSMRRELAEHNIKVSAINPGAVETEFSLVRLHGNEEKAKNVYQGFENLVAEDIADAVYYVISRPDHVNINDLIIMPKAQPAAGEIIRNKGL